MHYIIGDTHGHYSCLMELLEKLNLKEDDIVTLVGDVCDRAPNAKEQAKLLRWCFENISKEKEDITEHKEKRQCFSCGYAGYCVNNCGKSGVSKKEKDCTKQH